MNCMIIDDDDLSRKIIEKYILKVDYLDLLYSFPTAVDAINTVQTDEDIHLIFLDIEMPEMSGIEFLNTLQNLPQIIIISAKESPLLRYAFRIVYRISFDNSCDSGLLMNGRDIALSSESESR